MTFALLRSLWGFLKLVPWWVYVVLVAVVYHLSAVHIAENRGRDEANAKWEKIEALAKASSDAKIAELTQKARQQEADWQTKFAQIGVDYANDLKASEDQRAADVAAAKSGALKLRVAGGCNASGGSSIAQASSSPSRSDSPGVCELPPETTANLLALADDADRVVRKLTRCQEIVKADRSTLETKP